MKRGGRYVISSEGRHLGVRHVLYCREKRVYVSGDCHGTTPLRVWAWSGTPAQARRAREVFGIGEEFELYLDGEERGDG